MFTRDVRCKGCGNERRCLIRFKVELIKECPCKQCLIKVMCGLLCQEREDAYANFTDPMRQKLKQLHKLNITIRNNAYLKQQTNGNFR